MGRSNPKVLFISHSPHLGGAERCLHVLLEGMHREKFDLSLLVPPRCLVRRRGYKDLGELVARLGIPVSRTPIQWWAGKWPRYPAFALGLAKRVAKVADFLRRKQIDLVVSNTSVFAEGALAARSCGIPHVWHVLEMMEHDPVLQPVVPLPQVHHLMDRLSSRIITVSRAVKEGLERHIPAPKIRVVYTGIPEVAPRPMQNPKRTMFGLSSDVPVVTFLGLLSERKRAVDLIDAAPTVLKRFPRATFVFAGADGGEGRIIVDKIREYGIGHAVRMLGFRKDAADILAASDMLVLPSLADPLPLSVLEAMNAGIPVVGTRSGGCEEMIVDGETGYLTPCKSPNAIAKAILALLEKPSDRVQMGLAGHRRFMQYFSHSRYIAHFEVVLEETLAEANPPAIATAADSTQEIIERLRSSAFEQTRIHAAHENRGLALYRDYAEAMARCLAILG